MKSLHVPTLQENQKHGVHDKLKKYKRVKDFCYDLTVETVVSDTVILWSVWINCSQNALAM